MTGGTEPFRCLVAIETATGQACGKRSSVARVVQSNTVSHGLLPPLVENSRMLPEHDASWLNTGALVCENRRGAIDSGMHGCDPNGSHTQHQKNGNASEYSSAVEHGSKAPAGWAHVGSCRFARFHPSLPGRCPPIREGPPRARVVPNSRKRWSK